MELIRRETDYAIRALLRLAQHRGAELIPASRLSREERIPLDYSRKILQKLMKAGILASKEGNGGGYSLKRSLHAVTLAEVISIFQGPFHLSRCVITVDPCPNRARCKIRDQMIAMETFLEKYLDDIRISSLIRKEVKQR